MSRKTLDTSVERQTAESYPEHQKLDVISGKSQAIGTFIEWLQVGKDITLAREHQHNDSCYSEGDNGSGRIKICDMYQNELMPAFVDVQQLLAEFFEIDQRKLEDEKRAMLEECRQMNERPS